MSSQGSGPRKRKRQVVPKLVDPSVLKQGQEQHGKATGTVKNYTAMLAQADEWLPGQLEKLIEEQAQRREALPAEGLPKELTVCPSGESIPTDGSAKDAFRTPMECTPHLISLFAWSKCIESGIASEEPARAPAGASVLKTIHAAFMWRFEKLWGFFDFRFCRRPSSNH
jgi:hypothetical protein